MQILRYPYKPKAWAMALAGLFFAGCGYALYDEARTNDRGLIINHVIRLETDTATKFYWVLAALSAAFVVVALLGLLKGLSAPGEIVLDRAGLTAPTRAIGGTVTTVSYTAIEHLHLMQVGRQQFLIVRHAGGKLTINRAMLPTHAAFGVLAAELDRRWRAARPYDAA